MYQKSFLNFIRLTSICEQTVSLNVSIMLSTPVGFALNLFEVIPGPKCKKEVINFLMSYGEKFLGKTSVLAKDTPAFIGNRIGTFGIQSLFHLVKDGSFTVEEVDRLTGTAIGRPKSATFRTADLVGEGSSFLCNFSPVSIIENV